MSKGYEIKVYSNTSSYGMYSESESITNIIDAILTLEIKFPKKFTRFEIKEVKQK